MVHYCAELLCATDGDQRDAIKKRQLAWLRVISPVSSASAAATR